MHHPHEHVKTGLDNLLCNQRVVVAGGAASSPTGTETARAEKRASVASETPAHHGP